MGQYWLTVNLDKKEFINPHKLGCGLKLWEQLASHPSTGTALLLLTAAMPEVRGGGDFQLDEISKDVIGRWAGDRIALVGDYAKDTDLSAKYKASKIYEQCQENGKYTDITDKVCAVIEQELDGKFSDDGWKTFVRNS